MCNGLLQAQHIAYSVEREMECLRHIDGEERERVMSINCSPIVGEIEY